MAQNGQKVFGAGRFYGIATGDLTPAPFGLTQDMSVDFKRDIKRLYGQNQMPADAASGQLSIVGKVTNGVLSGRAFNDLMVGGTLSTGQTVYSQNETITITTGSTAGTPVNATALVQDLGLLIGNGAAAGQPLVRMSTITVLSTGQYSLSTAGAYALSSLESFTQIKATYTYSTIGGQTVTMTNQPMGKIGGFVSVLNMLWGADKTSITLNACIASDYGFATKLDDYNKPTFGFEAFADLNDNLGTFSFAELS